MSLNILKGAKLVCPCFRIRRTRLCAFTLVELLVVISIIALLLSILMPSLNRARESAKRVVCGNNLKSMGVARFMYQGDYNCKWPTISWNCWQDRCNYWQGQLAPYLGLAGNAVSQLVYAPSDGQAASPKYPDRQLKVYKCPSAKPPLKDFIWGHSYGINRYLYTTWSKKKYWNPNLLQQPRKAFWLMDATYYVIGDPQQAELEMVHYQKTKNILYADNHLELGFQDISEKTLPGIIGWYDYYLWGETVAGWAH